MSLNLGFVGDSITEGNAFPSVTPAPQQCGALVAANFGVTVNVVNRGQSGTASGDWTPGGIGWIEAANTAFAAASVTDVLVMLGANDCKAAANVSATTYGSNMGSITSYLTGAGYTVWLAYPIFASWDVGSPTLLLVQYQPKIDALIGGAVKAGDTLGFGQFQSNWNGARTWSDDGVHPNATGTPILAALWANPLIAAYGFKYARPRLSTVGRRVRAR